MEHIRQKIAKGERLDFDDGVFLFRHAELDELGALANTARENRHGNITYYNQNLHLNFTNICEAQCAFCSFSQPAEKPGEKAYNMDLKQCLHWIAKRYRPGMTEIHIVAGLNPSLPFSFYTGLLRGIRNRYPSLHIKAYSAVEIDYFAKRFGFSHIEVLKRLMEAGLQSLPGGGAEIFSHRVRDKLCPNKADAETWLGIHQTAHKLGLQTNCSMLYGTIESVEERVEHLLLLRNLQDSTGGFQAFIPLAFQPKSNRLRALGAPSANDSLRTMAASRLLLDNVPHIKAYWVTLGLETARTAQRFGADDIDGTVAEEKISHMAGANSPLSLSESELRELITSESRIPVERNTLYKRLDISFSKEMESHLQFGSIGPSSGATIRVLEK